MARRTPRRTPRRTLKRTPGSTAGRTPARKVAVKAGKAGKAGSPRLDPGEPRGVYQISWPLNIVGMFFLIP